MALSYAEAGMRQMAIRSAERDDARHEDSGRDVMDLDLVQWPAMAVTVVASWLVASTTESHRNAGFWVFMLSNVLWVVWGVSAGATALIALQVCLAALNIRGAVKT